MSGRWDALFEFVRSGFIEPLGWLSNSLGAGLRALTTVLWRFRWRLVVAAALGSIIYGLYNHPPFESVRRGEVLARTDALDGSVSVYGAGTILVLPGIQQVRRYSISDQVYRPTNSGALRFGPRLPLPKTVAANPLERLRSVHSQNFSRCMWRIWVRTVGLSTWMQCCGSVPSAGLQRRPHRSRDH
jgi:hypothetical protein